jgi:hypothetical protein
MTSARLPALGPFVMLWPPGFSSAAHFVTGTHPVHLMGSPSLSRPPFALKREDPVQDFLTCSPSPTT